MPTGRQQLAERARPAPERHFPRYRFAGPGRDFGAIDGYGAESLGLDTLGAAVPQPAPFDDPGPYGARGPLEPPAPRVACAPPLLIKVGRGLQRPTSTRVVYGAPPCGF